MKRTVLQLKIAIERETPVARAACGFSTKMTETECVAELFRRYQTLVAAEKGGQR